MTGWLGVRRVSLPEVTSTSDEAAILARGGAPHGTLVLAGAQTAGRGRQGRTWHSPSGDNVYLSAILRLGLAPAALPPLTLAIGLAVREAAVALGVHAAAVKWPNDVGVWRGAHFVKLAGVLTETTTRGGAIDAVIVGLGLNVGEGGELAEVGTSIARERGAGVTRDDVLEVLLPTLERWIDRFAGGGAVAIAAAFRAEAGFLGRHVTVRDGATLRGGSHGSAGRGGEAPLIAGRAVDVDDDCALVLDVGGRLDRIVSGEVSATGGRAAQVAQEHVPS